MDKQILNLILQIAKEIKRMRAYMTSCGFEIVEMTGKPYNMGMIADVDFITDNSLKHGEQFIKKVNRPQVIFKGVMIQKANIIVAQNL